MNLQSANDAELYYEVRGDGPPLLLMMDASGYGGVFGRFAELLADEFTVVTYDRRGNGQSPSPRAGMRPRRRSRPMTPPFGFGRRCLVNEPRRRFARVG
jgi:pimeloyl-ACP methyl ester carboxylesterase